MAEATAPSLPYDVVLRILERVKDVATLFRCATACKGWLTLVLADPSFLRRCLPEDAFRSAPFPGCFVQRRPRRGSPMPCLVPAPRPVWGSQCRSLNSFFPNLDNPGFFDHAVPLVSRHGLLLVRLDVHSASVRSVVFNRELLTVCNLVTGKFDVLPWLIHSFGVNLDETGYAMLTATDCSSSNDDDEQEQQLPLFKVLVISICQFTRSYHLHTFSSGGELRWNTCSGYVGGGITSKALKQHNAVVCRSMAHWLFEKASSFYTLDVSSKTGQVFFIEISIRLCGAEYDESYLSADTEGRLTLLQLPRDGLQLKTWRLHDNGGLIDMNPQVLWLKHPNQQKEIHGVVYTYLGETSGTLC